MKPIINSIFLRFLPSFVATLILTSCSNKLYTPLLSLKPTVLDLQCSARPESRYNDLSHGIYLMVSSEVLNSQIIDKSQLPTGSQNKFGNIEFVPTIKEFVLESMGTYIRSCGIKLGNDVNSDYTLRVKVKEFKFLLGMDPRATVILDYALLNTDNNILIQQTAVGRYNNIPKQMKIEEALDKAYSKALADIEWDGIASALRVHKLAAQEPTRVVQGTGNTSLEQTIIRWYIVSSPAGADVSWRVISSTPDVKNTNSTYVGTTPYETTESFDIRGLSLENSGNVQIEVTCERPGYLPQKKRFNLRQAIEQKEISAKFNLVKDE